MKVRLFVAGASLAILGALLPAFVAADDTVQVQLENFSVTPSESSVEAGEITLDVSVGSGRHELLVIRTDLAPDALPASDGQADESQLDVVGELRPAFNADAGSMTLTVNLDPGAYVLICNVFNPAFSPGHYGRGMSASLTVTEAAEPVQISEPATGNAGLAAAVTGRESTALILALAAIAGLLTFGARAVTAYRARQ